MRSWPRTSECKVFSLRVANYQTPTQRAQESVCAHHRRTLPILDGSDAGLCDAGLLGNPRLRPTRESNRPRERR